MKYLIILILIISNLYCIDTNINRHTNLFKEIKISNLNNKDTEYNMLYIDVRNVEIYSKQINNVKEIFKVFGNSLESEGIVFHLKYASLHSKKKYLNKIQNNLDTNFDYYNSPFLIFYKKIDNNYEPYKILSFSDMPLVCIQESLNRIEKAIYNNELTLELKNTLSSFKEYECTVFNKNKELLGTNIHEIINYIIAFIENRKSNL